MRRLMGAFAAALVVFTASASAAAAHVKATTGYSQIRSAPGGTVAYELHLEYAPLVRAAGLDQTTLEASDDGARAASLAAGRAAIAAYVGTRVRLYLDEAECGSELEDSSIEHRDDAPFAYLRLTYDCPGAADGRYRLMYTVFSDADAVVDDHTNIVDYRLGGATGRVVVDRQAPEFTSGQGSPVSTLVRFGRLGFEHLFGGLDHVLFVAALVLGASSLAAVLKVASMFTLAHSVTLALAALGWVHVPGAIVEPLIALSIAYVAVENLLGGETPYRLAVVFGFGLLHGLGFAGSMSFTGELSWPLVTSLVGFNAGIELAQCVLLLALFPVVAVARRFSWSTLTQAGATTAVAAFGLLWFAQRVTFA